MEPDLLLYRHENVECRIVFDIQYTIHTSILYFILIENTAKNENQRIFWKEIFHLFFLCGYFFGK